MERGKPAVVVANLYSFLFGTIHCKFENKQSEIAAKRYGKASPVLPDARPHPKGGPNKDALY